MTKRRVRTATCPSLSAATAGHSSACRLTHQTPVKVPFYPYVATPFLPYVRSPILFCTPADLLPRCTPPHPFAWPHPSLTRLLVFIYPTPHPVQAPPANPRPMGARRQRRPPERDTLVRQARGKRRRRRRRRQRGQRGPRPPAPRTLPERQRRRRSGPRIEKDTCSRTRCSASSARLRWN